jgi:perosamine synthetase
MSLIYDFKKRERKMNAPEERRAFIPYGRQAVDGEDIRAVQEVLESDWLTTGPKIAEFEGLVSRYVDARFAVAVNSGTAGLHSAMFALGIGPGDEVICPPMTFAATANCILYRGAMPVFVDVEPGTLLIDPPKVKASITPRTKAIIGVDYAGQPCAWDALREIAGRYRLALVADGCHALGAEFRGMKVGSLADLTVFSFHPVKHITTGEGGMIVTDDRELAERMRAFRNHGITSDHRERGQRETWLYEMNDLGFNYRITDFQCALGISQLRKLPGWLARRREIAARYDAAFADVAWLKPLAVRPECAHAYHLYVVEIDAGASPLSRSALFQVLRRAGIGANVHYIPVHLHPYYREHLGTGPGLCPAAEAAYERILSLPIYPGMTDAEQEFVIDCLRGVME